MMRDMFACVFNQGRLGAMPLIAICTQSDLLLNFPALDVFLTIFGIGTVIQNTGVVNTAA